MWFCYRYSLKIPAKSDFSGGRVSEHPETSGSTYTKSRKCGTQSSKFAQLVPLCGISPPDAKPVFGCLSVCPKICHFKFFIHFFTSLEMEIGMRLPFFYNWFLLPLVLPLTSNISWTRQTCRCQWKRYMCRCQTLLSLENWGREILLSKVVCLVHNYSPKT